MEAFQTEHITCPKCGKKQEVKIYPSINANYDTEAKEKLMHNQLFSFTCEECGETTPLLFNCLYHDMENGLMVWLMPEAGDKELQEMNETVTQMQAFGMTATGLDYRYRIVRTVNELKEKLLIEQENLDDRIIELVKVVYLVQIAEQIGSHTVAEVMFDVIDDSYFFTVFYEEDSLDPGVIPLDMNVYRMVKEQYIEKLDSLKADNFQDISFLWAREFMFS